MKATTVSINYLEVDINVVGTYYKGTMSLTYYDPPDEEEFDIRDVLIGEISIVHLLSDRHLHDIESQILNDVL